MIPYATYKVVHLIGIMLAFAALGGVMLTVANGATKQTSRVKKLVGITHGVAMFVVLLGGFGLLARLNIVQSATFPGWVWGKLAIWLILSVMLAVPYRKPELARPLFFLLPVLGGIAAWLAIFKPF
jgi:uncharacterized membrane protein SirB2